MTRNLRKNPKQLFLIVRNVITPRDREVNPIGNFSDLLHEVRIRIGAQADSQNRNIIIRYLFGLFESGTPGPLWIEGIGIIRNPIRE